MDQTKNETVPCTGLWFKNTYCQWGLFFCTVRLIVKTQHPEIAVHIRTTELSQTQSCYAMFHRFLHSKMLKNTTRSGQPLAHHGSGLIQAVETSLYKLYYRDLFGVFRFKFPFSEISWQVLAFVDQEGMFLPPEKSWNAGRMEKTDLRFQKQQKKDIANKFQRNTNINMTRFVSLFFFERSWPGRQQTMRGWPYQRPWDPAKRLSSALCCLEMGHNFKPTKPNDV